MSANFGSLRFFARFGLVGAGIGYGTLRLSYLTGKEKRHREHLAEVEAQHAKEQAEAHAASANAVVSKSGDPVEAWVASLDTAATKQ